MQHCKHRPLSRFFGWIAIVATLFSGSNICAESIVLPDDDLPILEVYMNEDPPHAHQTADGLVVGLWVDSIRAYLDQTGLDYEIKIVPWQRAVRSVEKNNNALIAHFDRTFERENSFVWLKKLQDVRYQLIGRFDIRNQHLTKEAILAGPGKAVCIINSSHCHMLREFGFPEERIWIIPDFNGEAVAPLIERGRADYWVDDFTKMKDEFAFLQKNLNIFAPIIEIGVMGSYLAAPKTLHPRLLERLIAVSAAQTGTMNQ